MQELLISILLSPAEEFVNLFGKWPPHYEEIISLTFHQQVVYQSIVRDWLSPLRIAIGYNGFKSEDALRASIFKIYQGKEYQSGYGVQNMPNLIISDGYSLIKMNGMPYKGFWDDEDGWCWLGSSDANPILLIMELLFDRIHLLLGVTSSRGNDLNEEPLFPLALSKPVQDRGVKGWSTSIISDPIPEREITQMQWSSLRLSHEEKEFLRLLHTYGPLKNDSKLLSDYKTMYEIDDIFDVTQSLLKSRAVLATDDQFCICSGQWSVAKVCGIFYCGDNSGNRFEHWVRLNTVPPWQIGKLLRISPSSNEYQQINFIQVIVNKRHEKHLTCKNCLLCKV